MVQTLLIDLLTAPTDPITAWCHIMLQTEMVHEQHFNLLNNSWIQSKKHILEQYTNLWTKKKVDDQKESKKLSFLLL